VTESEPLLEIEPSALVLSAFKPAENGKGVVVRVSNPTPTSCEARMAIGFSFQKAEMLRLDETPEPYPLRRKGQTLCFSVPPHALRTIGIV
jgi:alpha-mannosidase